jgi:hypothetical protein
MTDTTQPRSARLYDLLPAIYRMRDAEQGYPLQALLEVIGEQVNVVEDDIAQLYANWFIETAEPWVIPYIADLIGYRPVLSSGEAGTEATAEGRALQRVLAPRREVAHTIGFRRRKGTLALLEQLAHDIAGWPARPVEFFKLLAWNQNLNHQHLHRARTASLHHSGTLDLIGGPFDRTAHTVDVRRVDSARTRGWHNIPSVGLFVWRLRSYSVTKTPANCIEATAPNCFTFSVLGQDAPLFTRPQRDDDAGDIAGELELPTPIRRRGFLDHPGSYYGVGESLTIWAEGWAGQDADTPIPPEAIIPADLSGWRYVPRRGHVAVDPVLGRFAFAPNQLPRRGVRVSYQYGFPADIGGGEYDRPILDPSPRAPSDGAPPVPPTHYRVGKGLAFARIGDALVQWQQDQPLDAVIEIAESGVYVEPIQAILQPGQTLQIRAANHVRPVIRLLDWQTDLPDAMSVSMGEGSRFTMDGIMVTGRGLQVTGPITEGDQARASVCASELVIRHCTLVPGWGIDCDCEPLRPAEASLELSAVRSSVCIEHSIVGSILVQEEELHTDAIPVTITDSLVDAAGEEREAIGGLEDLPAHAVLTIRRCTVFGTVDVHAVALAENCIFNDCVHVARRQTGCMRFCFVPEGCRTPRRYHCQSDLVVEAVRQRGLSPGVQQTEEATEILRVRPQYTDRRYGHPAYAQLAATCAPEIKQGADGESEMGAYHDLFEPQRTASLEARLDEFTPAGMDVGIIFAT